MLCNYNDYLLGGVFIATIFGLVLAMITLAGEIFYHKRKKRNNVQQVKPAVVQPGYNYGAHYDPPLKERPLRRVTIGKINFIFLFARTYYNIISNNS